MGSVHVVIYSRAPLEVNYFAVFKSFESNTAISANFVQTVKNSNDKTVAIGGCRVGRGC